MLKAVALAIPAAATVIEQVLPRGTCPALTLNRHWVLPDVTEARAFAMPVLPPLQETAVLMRALVHDSPPVQLVIKAASVAAHLQSQRLERWKV